jgi:FecR protein
MLRRYLPVAALLLGVGPVAAQTEAPPPHLSVLEGRAEIARGAEREPAVANTPLILGDQLATTDGRAEVLLGDGSALHLDQQTTVDFNGDTVVRLVSGRVIVLAERGAAGALQIDAAPASVRFQSSAEVHLALLDERGQPTLQVAVIRGLVDVDSGSGPVSVQAGQQVFVREGEAPSYPAPFNSARLDGFARWSQALFDGRRGTTSAQYLPADVRVYGSTFDQYGSWSYNAPYGYVWYPRVAASWRPYYHGRWRHAGRYGWNFVGYDPWGWATHHYGRWGLSTAGAWYWIPSAGWGAAWVNWAVAPGYVGWCPLGWNNRPVLGFWGHGTRSAYYGGRGHYDPWRAWSVIPTHSFRRGSAIHREPFDRRGFTGPRAPSFVVQPTPPSSVAIPRGSTVASGSRIAGPSVAPRAGQSRRGAPVADPGTTSRSTAPAASSRSFSSASARGGQPARGGPPAVIYHRGTPVEPRSGSSGASAYEQAGVAVPRGLPAERGAVPGPAGIDPRARYGNPASASPYGGSASPYTRGRSSDAGDPGATRSRPSDHPDYAAPRGGDRPSPPQYRAPEQPRSRAPEAPRYQPSDRGRGSQGEAPRATPRSTPSPRAEGPSSRAQGVPAGPRSGSSGGSSSGTAVPRRR